MPGKLKTRTETYIGNFVIDRGPHLAEFRKNKGILTAPFMRESTFFKEKAKGHRMHLLTDGWHLHRCFWPGSETLIPLHRSIKKRRSMGMRECSFLATICNSIIIEMYNDMF